MINARKAGEVALPDIFYVIKNRIPITEAMSLYGFKPNSFNKIKCPFHNEKTPSMVIYPNTNSFYCYGCGTGGSVIDFVSRYYNLEPIEAAKKLDSDFRLNLFDSELTPEQELAIHERQKDKEFADSFKVWEQSYYIYVCERIQLLKELESSSRPTPDGELSDDFMMAVNELQRMECHWDILFNGSLEDKVSLYIDISKAVNYDKAG